MNTLNKEFETNHKELTDKVDSFDPRFDALERLDE